jgi:hypothetical protein
MKNLIHYFTLHPLFVNDAGFGASLAGQRKGNEKRPVKTGYWPWWKGRAREGSITGREAANSLKGRLKKAFKSRGKNLLGFVRR